LECAGEGRSSAFGGLEVGCWNVQQREGAERLVG
jgi:hypothetical protein